MEYIRAIIEVFKQFMNPVNSMLMGFGITDLTTFYTATIILLTTVFTIGIVYRKANA